MKTENVEIPY